MTTIQFTKHAAGHAPGTIQELSDHSARIIISLGFAVKVERKETIVEKVEKPVAPEKIEVKPKPKRPVKRR